MHELKNLVSNVFFTVKKMNGEKYGPNSVTSSHRSTDCCLCEVGWNAIHILKDCEFAAGNLTKQIGEKGSKPST